MPKAPPSKDLLEIHLDRLEEDAAAQPQLMFAWGSELARARKLTKEAKRRLKLTEAEACKNIREDPEAFIPGGKVTEKSLEEVLLKRTDCQEAATALIEAEYNEDVLDAFVRAITDRREQIGNEVKLHGQMYFALPDRRAAGAQEAASHVKFPKPRKS